MRRYRLRSLMALIAIIGLSMWVGMWIERARSSPRPVYTVYRPVKRLRSYTVVRPVTRTGTTAVYTVTRPVKPPADR